MLHERKRLLGLVAVAVALAGAYVILHGLPGTSGPARGGSAAPRRSASPSRPDAAAAPAPAKDAVPSGAQRMDYHAVTALARRRDPRDLERLKQAARDGDWKARHAAVTGIGRLKEQGDPAYLLSVFTDRGEKIEIRAAAAQALGQMRHLDAGDALIDALDDSSVLIRTRAGVAIRRIMQVSYRYDPRGPIAERRKAIQRIRNAWPRLYKIFTQGHRRKG